MDFSKYLNGLKYDKSNLTDKDFNQIESEVGFPLPSEYKKFLREIDGCEGLFNGKNYAILWKGKELGEYNAKYQVKEFLEDMLLFGSDGGGEAFAFDKMNNMAIVRVPFVGMERELATYITSSFDSFIIALCERDIYES